MIYSIKGRIRNKFENYIVVDLGSFSMTVIMSTNSINSLSKLSDEKIEVLTYLNVREDALELYGFLDNNEIDLFKQLINISKIGPKMAISILSYTSPNIFIRNIKSNNIDEITKISGIGRKTAQRIILELKDKLELNIKSEKDLIDIEVDSLHLDVSRSLISLGINKIDVEKVIKEMKNDGQFNGKLEVVIKKALSRL
ncbi:MAG: Holliday junction branch migration protein RuvA [Candidatus Marinimicrobia bacterium]|nr:Holliday junction branch migration protein RuvA [Candidatus Neomarinimicrobiota bacterium]OUW50643.1 MAG: Holliday junction branch migration protein RuvA [bacterium TMED190]